MSQYSNNRAVGLHFPEVGNGTRSYHLVSHPGAISPRSDAFRYQGERLDRTHPARESVMTKTVQQDMQRQANMKLN
jgi:hypothetical protein